MNISEAEKYIWHVLEVYYGSPADISGLRPYSDYIIAGDSLFDNENAFYELIENNEGQAVKLVAWNCETDAFRTVTVVPNRNWRSETKTSEGDSLLGCGIGFGLLHRIPSQATQTSQPIDIKQGKQIQSGLMTDLAENRSGLGVYNDNASFSNQNSPMTAKNAIPNHSLSNDNVPQIENIVMNSGENGEINMANNAISNGLSNENLISEVIGNPGDYYGNQYQMNPNTNENQYHNPQYYNPYDYQVIPNPYHQYPYDQNPQHPYYQQSDAGVNNAP